MQCLRKTVACLSIASISAASFCGGSTAAAPQHDTPCTETKVPEQSCATFNWVYAERGKPFVAERVVSSVEFSTPSHEDVEIIRHERAEVIARDSIARIREEFYVRHQGTGVVSSHGKLALGGVASSRHDLNSDISAVDDPGEHATSIPEELTVSILDCFGGKRIQLTPSAQTAIVQESCAQLPIFQPSDQPYSYKLTRFLNTNPRPDTTVEDLGYKQLQTFRHAG